MEITNILGEEEFDRELNSNKLVLVDFKASWCEPCKLQAEVLSQFVTKIGDRVKVLKVDIDENPTLAKKHQISLLPTLVLFCLGTERERKTGLTSLDALSSLIIKYI